MANEKRLIDANALKQKLIFVRLYAAGLRCGKTLISKILETYRSAVFEEIDNATTVDTVSRGVYDQVRWERDTAIGQLEEHGIPFGGIAPDVVKVVRCKDCKFYELKHYVVDGGYRMCCENKKGIWTATPPDAFCSYGERRTDNG